MRVPKIYMIFCVFIVSFFVLYAFQAPATYAAVNAGQSPAPAPTQTPIPHTCDAGVDQTIRFPDSANLLGSSGGFISPSYYWLPQAGVTYGNASAANSTISFSAPGMYTVYLRCREPNGYYILDNLTIRVNPPLFTAPLPIASALVANYASDDIWAIDLAKAAVVGAVSVGRGPMDVLVSPDGKRAYVANFMSHNVHVIDTATLTVVAIVTVNRNPCNLGITPDGSILFVSNFSSNLVTFINTTTNLVIDNIPVNQPRGLAVKRDGSRLYVAGYTSNLVSEIDVPNRRVLRTVNLGARPISLTLSKDEKSLYATTTGVTRLSLVNTETFANPTTIALAHYPTTIALSPNGLFLATVSANTGYVTLIDTSDNSVSASFYVGNAPSDLAISQDSSMIYVTNTSSNTVAFIDVANRRVHTTVGVYNQPKSIALLEPKGLALYFKFDDPNPLKDYSINNNYAEILNNVPWVPGFMGNAYSFDGIATNKIRVPYSNSIDITGQEVTITAWIKPRACPASGVYGEIVKHLQTTTPGGFQLELNGTQNCTIRFNYRNGDDTFTSGTGTTLIPGVWYHVAGGKNATHIWTAINGQIDLYDDSIGSILPNTQPLIVGGQVSAGSGGTTFDGLIDEVMVFNRALSETEVRNIYLNGMRH